MNELFARITNLSYEIFGVILPGMVLNLLLLLWWVAIGDYAPTLSAGLLPIFSMNNLQHLLESLTFITGIGAFIPVLVMWYFSGHLVLRVTRSVPRVDDKKLSAIKRVFSSLFFRIPKPNSSYDDKLSKLYEIVCQHFSRGEVITEWRQFYPLAKCFISQRLATSLVTTYQNKYTFHRSVVGAASILFWLSILSATFMLITSSAGSSSHSIVAIIILCAGCIALVWGFSSSYMFHWRNYGNSLITESYSLIQNPVNDDV